MITYKKATHLLHKGLLEQYQIYSTVTGEVATTEECSVTFSFSTDEQTGSIFFSGIHFCPVIPNVRIVSNHNSGII